MGKQNIVTCVAKARLPTKYGFFHLFVYHDKQTNDKKDHIVLVKGSVKNKANILTRIHSECITGDVFNSMRCDCAEQLHSALNTIKNVKDGILIYLRQEGRGIGLLNKILAYGLQDQGLNTITANKALGLPIDSRDYSIAVAILDDLKIKSIKLLTNNPKKMEIFKKDKITVVERVPIEIEPNPHNTKYLQIKRDELGHLLILDSVKAENIDPKVIKLKYFFDESYPHFEFSNFGGKGNYVNRYNDKGEYTEITYQASKFAYLQDEKLSKKLKKEYFKKVSTPAQAFNFMRKKRHELSGHSVNDILDHSTWFSKNGQDITNKETEMLYCLLNKFNPVNNPVLFKKLINAIPNNETVLVEANPNDYYWGYKKNKLGLMLTALALMAKDRSYNEWQNKLPHVMALFMKRYKLLLGLFEGFNFYKKISRKK